MEVSCEEGKRGERRRDRKRQAQRGRELTIHTVGVLPLAGVKSHVKKCTTLREQSERLRSLASHTSTKPVTSYNLLLTHTHQKQTKKTTKNVNNEKSKWLTRRSEGPVTRVLTN